jgi:peptidoglycan/xylan/chitin deacetylase (PgdA/CDA1 family)
MNDVGNRGTGLQGNSVPVLMYHGVGKVMDDWRWSELTVPYQVFEDHLKCLAKKRFRTVDFDDLHAHVSGERRLDDRCIVLTFDDGYLDNWTYALPLMEKYGFSGTVLVTPEFVDPRDLKRPTISDAPDPGGEEPPYRGFMSWPELRSAVQSGTLTVQCHAMTHTWYPVDEEVVDFHHPGDAYYWIDWNAHSDKKPFYLEDPRSSRVPFGTPVYRHAQSLAAVRYLPDSREAGHMASWVDENGGEDLFQSAGWRESLFAELRRWRAENHPEGRLETDDERRERLRRELVESKRVLEEKLGVAVDYLVWPAGGYDERAMTEALSIYKGVTISSRERWSLSNRTGEDPRKIVRRGIPALEVGGQTCYMGGRYLVEFVEEFKGSAASRKRRQAMKLCYMAAAALGLWPKRPG